MLVSAEHSEDSIHICRTPECTEVHEVLMGEGRAVEGIRCVIGGSEACMKGYK